MNEQRCKMCKYNNIITDKLIELTCLSFFFNAYAQKYKTYSILKIVNEHEQFSSFE